jgi:hypothetical protein
MNSTRRIAILALAIASPLLVQAEPGTVVQTLRNPQPESFAQFGLALVPLNGEEIAVSAPGATRDIWREGAVYILSTSSGDARLRLHRPSPQDTAGFGRALAVAGGRLVVADPSLGVRTDRDLNSVGAVHVYALPTGEHVQTLANPDPHGNDYFGWAILRHQLLGGSPPAAPYPICGHDGVGEDHLLCVATSACVPIDIADEGERP